MSLSISWQLPDSLGCWDSIWASKGRSYLLSEYARLSWPGWLGLLGIILSPTCSSNRLRRNPLLLNELCRIAKYKFKSAWTNFTKGSVFRLGWPLGWAPWQSVLNQQTAFSKLALSRALRIGLKSFRLARIHQQLQIIIFCSCQISEDGRLSFRKLLWSSFL